MLAMRLLSTHRLACSVLFSVPFCVKATRYDYIIIGGGTSGLVVANRLTENCNVTVLVIEAGPLDDGSPGTLVPSIETPAEYHRVYNSTPQPQLLNRVSQLTTAEVVGGGTVINGMFFNRGSKEDYDAWAELGNGDGWSWEGLLPYFKKSENFTAPTQEIQETFDISISADLTSHGTRGPVGSSFPPFGYEITKYFYEAWKYLGLEQNPQPNAGRAVGAFQSSLSLTAWNMSRSHASVAYYKGEPSRRPNLTLITKHRVHRVVFEGERAVGVEYSSDHDAGTILKVSASREVIAAAGAQRSPQVLQLSGIGPRALLSRYNITMIEDLPGVGYNFHDQPNYFMYLTNNSTLPSPSRLISSDPANQSYASQQLDLYYENRTGAYTKTFQGGGDKAFLPLLKVTDLYRTIIENASTANLEMTLPAGAHETVLRGQQAQQKILLRHFASPDTGTGEIICDTGDLAIIAHLKPLSRGSILVASTDPYMDPLIDFGTFMHPTDLDILVAAFKKTQEMVASPPFQSIAAQAVVDIQADEDIIKELRNATLSSWQHPVGSLAMLPRELGGVVDSRLCVYGVNGLRVVDASMMPIIPASHTSSTVYAVAEKAADLIKEGAC